MATTAGSKPQSWLPQPLPASVRITPKAIAAAFDLKPVDAIRLFASLGINVDWNWREDAALARGLSFSVARVASVNVLAAIKAEVMRALRSGITMAQFRRYLAGRLAKLGWLAQKEVVMPDGTLATVDLSTAWRMNVIYRTNMQTAYMAGRYEAQLANVDAEPFWQYVAVLDDRTRDTHRAMHGAVYKWNDPIWNSIYPPNGYNCRCRVRALSPTRLEDRGLDVLDSASDPPPDNFPDAGFGLNPGVPGAREQSLSAAMGAAKSALNAPPPPFTGYEG